MHEDFLFFIWENDFYNKSDFITSAGDTLNILSRGERNHNSGPDYFNAKVKIGETIWVGNIEFHVKASDWRLHKHQYDNAYNNVILHVVYNADIEIRRNNLEAIPTLEIGPRIPLELYDNYQSLVAKRKWIPCEEDLHKIDELVLSKWKERAILERLEYKVAAVISDLKTTKNNWEEVLLILLAKAFGYKVNELPFELLIKSIPYVLINRFQYDNKAIEALLFGQSGLLDNVFEDEYPNELITSYNLLQQKYSLQPIQKHSWKLSKMRPRNFPAIRISQLASLISKNSILLKAILNNTSIDGLLRLLSCKASSYWDTHYTFDSVVKNSSTMKLGSSGKSHLIINCVAPFLYCYGKQKGIKRYQEIALQLLKSLPKENNNVLRKMETVGFHNNSAFDSQSWLHTQSQYCSQKKCLDCDIGINLLRKYSDDRDYSGFF